MSDPLDEWKEVYREIEKRAVGWTACSLSYFDPDEAQDSQKMFARKALAELALLVAYRVKLDHSPLEDDYQKILDHVENISSRPSYRELIARDHRSILLYALSYASLKICGRDDQDFRHIIEQALTARLPLILERIPYRQLDLLHFLYITDFQLTDTTFEDIFPLTLLAGQPSVVELNDDDAYAITHALFYITDFGLRSARWPKNFNLTETNDLLKTLMSHYRICNNADLLAELIASSQCLGHKTSPEIDRAWQFLHHYQNEDGRVAGPAGFVDEIKAESIGGPKYKDWITSYHTTMVVALAALMARRSIEVYGYPAQQVGETVMLPVTDDYAEKSRSSISQSVAWLQIHVGHINLSIALRAAAGLSVASEIVTLPAATIAELKTLANRIEKTEQISWAELGADTMLLVAECFKRVNISCPKLDRELDAVAANLDLSLLNEYPSAYFASRKLCQLGKINQTKFSLAMKALPLAHPFPDAEESVADFASRLLQTTGAELQRVDLNYEGLSETTDLLASEIIRACREYRLGDAALFQRALMLCEPKPSRLSRDTISYFLSQQKPNGCFGYLATDQPNAEQLDRHLTWTIGILMALSNFIDGLDLTADAAGTA